MSQKNNPFYYPVRILFLIIPIAILAAGIKTSTAKAALLDKDTITETYSEDDNFSSSTQIAVTELDLGDYADIMAVGERQLLSVTVLPESAAYTEIIYSSADPDVATINGLGRITAISAGTTQINISCGGITDSFLLTVKENTDEIIAVKDIEISDYDEKLEVDKTMTLAVAVLPSNATDSTISFQSSNTEIATVNSSGEVKGVSKGKVIIYISAGTVIKEVPLNIVVASTAITLNSNYLVLKIGDEYQLAATVSPFDAPQNITYKSTDTSIATVSSDGLVTAKSVGNTAVIVSNGDISVSVSVIINESFLDVLTDNESVEPNNTIGETFPTLTTVTDYPLLDTTFLRNLYDTQTSVTILGKGYSMIVNGNDIKNYNNELQTDIQLSETSDGESVSFVLNGGNQLCGTIILSLNNPNGRFLYLYNESKKKYEFLQTGDLEELSLSSPGIYKITNKKISTIGISVMYMLIGGGIFIIIGVGIYIALKKKYWFW